MSLTENQQRMLDVVAQVSTLSDAGVPTGGAAKDFMYAHPQYRYFAYEWRKMRDSMGGQRRIKEAGTRYLPPTAGMVLDGMQPRQLGAERYMAYLSRARYHAVLPEAVLRYLGLLHQQEAAINLPPELEPLRSKATKDGETLQALIVRITYTQLLNGRIGLMFDIDTTDPSNPVPFISTYEAEAIPNWDKKNAMVGTNSLQMVLLDESVPKRGLNFSWETDFRFRSLMLGKGDGTASDGVDTYSVSVWEGMEGPDGTPTKTYEPVYRGKPLKEIPFVFVNAADTLPDVGPVPLSDLADVALTAYRTEADYRQALYMQGQDTLVVIGGRTDPNTDVRVGSGQTLYVELGGDAKYIGVSGAGLPEMRMAVQNDLMEAQRLAGEAIAQQKTNAESGAAMGTRMAAQTASLNNIASTCGAALNRLLQIAAEWMGADATKVDIKPNLEFSDFTLPGQELQALSTGKNVGLPLSNRSIHAMLKNRGITQMTYEEEMAELVKDVASRKAWGLPDLDAPKTAAPLPGSGVASANDPRNTPQPSPSNPNNAPAAKTTATSAAKTK